jgi:hypothetical protein
MNKYERWRIEEQELVPFVEDLYPDFYNSYLKFSSDNFGSVDNYHPIIYLSAYQPLMQYNSTRDALCADIQYLIDSLINNDERTYQFTSIKKEGISDYYVRTKKYLHNFVKIKHFPKVRFFLKDRLDHLLLCINKARFVVATEPQE